MVKLKSNNGFTLIEMVFVLLLVQVLVLCASFHFPNQERVQLCFIEEMLKETQLKSLIQMENNEIEIENSTLWVNEQSYDISPLVCEAIQFHYNEKGHISQADSFECKGKKLEARFIFQLGSGWMRIEM